MNQDNLIGLVIFLALIVANLYLLKCTNDTSKRIFELTGMKHTHYSLVLFGFIYFILFFFTPFFLIGNFFFYRKRKKELDTILLQGNIGTSKVQENTHSTIISQGTPLQDIPLEEYTLEKLASMSFDQAHKLKGHPDLIFRLAFEWEKIGDCKVRLRYKSFRCKGLNLAFRPFFSGITMFDTPSSELYLYEDTLYSKEWKYDSMILSKASFTFKEPHWSDNFSIPFPCQYGLVKVYPFECERESEYSSCEILKDNVLLLEFDYSPEAIDKANALHRQNLDKEAESNRRSAVNEEKRKIKERLKREEIKKQAEHELEDEGILFPEAGKRPPIPKDVVDAIWRRDGGKCVYCGSTENLQIDHIIPFSKGGSSNIENLQLLCQKCNLKKSNHIG